MDLIQRHQPKIVDEVAGLVFIPPAERFGIHADFLERRERALDLDGLAAVRKRERKRAVDQNFHLRNVPSAALPGNAILSLDREWL
jgi:hypothetical protein